MTKSCIFFNNINTNKPGSAFHVKQTEAITETLFCIINLAT